MVWVIEIVPKIGCEMFMVVINSSGPVNTVSKVRGISSAGICTEHFKVTLDPMGCTGLGRLLDSVTEIGAGTA